MQKEDKLDVVIMGSAGIGKSASSIRFNSGIYVEYYDPTIEDSHRKQLVLDSEVVLMDMLDTAGEEQSPAITEEHIRAGQGFLVMYSITSRDSFDEAANLMENIKRLKEQQYLAAVLVGNKCDVESEREVGIEEGARLACKYHAPFFETSAKLNVNTTEAFHEIARQILKHKRKVKSLQVPRRQEIRK